MVHLTTHTTETAPSRGGKVGRICVWPKGWHRLALKVRGVYSGCDAWLEKSAAGWPVAFHGTRGDPDVLKHIVSNGLRVRGGKTRAANGELFGKGIYCTPDPGFAAYYAGKQPLKIRDGLKVMVIVQCRVRPGSFSSHNHKKGACWVVQEGDIRPCGILVREVS